MAKGVKGVIISFIDIDGDPVWFSLVCGSGLYELCYYKEHAHVFRDYIEAARFLQGFDYRIGDKYFMEVV